MASNVCVAETHLRAGRGSSGFSIPFFCHQTGHVQREKAPSAWVPGSTQHGIVAEDVPGKDSEGEMFTVETTKLVANVLPEHNLT